MDTDTSTMDMYDGCSGEVTTKEHVCSVKEVGKRSEKLTYENKVVHT